jgi:hypothetical protein
MLRIWRAVRPRKGARWLAVAAGRIGSGFFTPMRNAPCPGFVKADLVAHSGPVAKGSFVQTLVLTDSATGWTDWAPLLVREQRLLREVLGELRKLLPFPLLGLDTDNDSVFMNGIGQILLKANSSAQKTHSAHRGGPIRPAPPQPVCPHGLQEFRTAGRGPYARSTARARPAPCLPLRELVKSAILPQITRNRGMSA